MSTLASSQSAQAIGPDSYGYSANPIAFSFDDIATTGTRFLADVDDQSQALALPFAFDFYGTSRSTVYASSNALLTFEGGNTNYSNTPLTGAIANLPTIAVIWDDWVTYNSADAMYYETLGAPGARRFVVQWNMVNHFSYFGNNVTFQAVLHEGTDRIDLRYRDLNTGQAGSRYGVGATVGIRDTSGHTNGRNLQWSHNQCVIGDRMALRFETGTSGPYVPNQATTDSDNDGVNDACDPDDGNDGIADEEQPIVVDPDGDGHASDADNCPAVANADQTDTDGDGTGDACEADTDADTVIDDTDNCPTSSNTDQANNDNDAEGDACDADDDNDGTADNAPDNCQFVSNGDQADTDGDGDGDACDADDDNDAVADGSDNCQVDANTDQADNDNDSQGDVCDADDDNDTVIDAADNCPTVTNAAQTDTEGDGIGDACDSLTYAFAGFYAPVDNLPVLNTVKAGSSVPVKFSLGGNRGMSIFKTGSPASITIPCGVSGQYDAIEETSTAGSSSLTYDAVTDRYQFVWKTSKEWVNTCRQLVLKTADGGIHRANFKLK